MEGSQKNPFLRHTKIRPNTLSLSLYFLIIFVHFNPI